MYSALDIAKHIINYCIDRNIYISNLKLQKLLYFVWVEYYRETQQELFSDEICAWQLGPVVPIVYYEYCTYAGAPIIIRKEAAEISYGDEMIIDQVLDTYAQRTAADLVDETHRVGTPWYRIYRDGSGNRERIPFALIKKLVVQ